MMPTRGGAEPGEPQGKRPLRIVVVEDHYLVREGVKMLLETEPGIEVLATCGDFDSALTVIGAELPDVVLTDIRMPPNNTDEGIRLATQLRKTHPEIGVVVLSQYSEPRYALMLLESGSDRCAYVLKDRLHDREQLVQAIRAVANGESVIDPKVVELLVRARTRSSPSPLEELTRREREILTEIATGKSNAAIAETLVLSKRAVEKHINSIFWKLDLTDTAQVSPRVKATLMRLSEAGD